MYAAIGLLDDFDHPTTKITLVVYLLLQWEDRVDKSWLREDLEAAV
jgi:hypothetical protein